MTGASIPTSAVRERPESLFLCLRVPSFGAQAIALKRRGLRHRAFVVVRQNAEAQRSRVWSVSRRAAASGVDRGMPVFHVQRNFPSVLVLRRDDAAERQACGQMLTLLESYSPVHGFDGSGQGFLDLAGTPIQHLGAIGRFAEELTGRIAKLGLDEVAIGVSKSKIVADMAARGASGSNIVLCEPGNEEEMLSRFDARLLPGLSASCRTKLQRYGLTTVGQVRSLSREALAARFGREGQRLFGLARGLDVKSTSPEPPRIWVETLLDRDIVDEQMLCRSVRYTTDKLCHELWSRELLLRSMILTIRYSDGMRVQRTASLQRPTQSFSRIARVAVGLFRKVNQRRIAIRSISIRVVRAQTDHQQCDLFESTVDVRDNSLAESIARIRNRSSFGAILTASTLVFQRDADGLANPDHDQSCRPLRTRCTPQNPRASTLPVGTSPKLCPPGPLPIPDRSVAPHSRQK